MWRWGAVRTEETKSLRNVEIYRLRCATFVYARRTLEEIEIQLLTILKLNAQIRLEIYIYHYSSSESSACHLVVYKRIVIKSIVEEKVETEKKKLYCESI